MKLLSYLPLLCLMFIAIGCSDQEETLDANFTSDISLEQRKVDCEGQGLTDCCQYASLLRIFTYYVNLANNGSNVSSGRLLEAFNNLQCAISACTNGAAPNCSGYVDNCDNIPNLVFGAPQSAILNDSYCRLNCALLNYDESQSTEDFGNVFNAYCYYIQALASTGFSERYNNRCGPINGETVPTAPPC